MDKLDENDPNSVFKKLIESSFSGDEARGEMSGNLREILLGAIGVSSDAFEVDFFKNLQVEGEDLLQTFTRFATVVQNTDDFMVQFSRHTEEIGKTTEQAFLDIQIISNVLQGIDSTLDSFTETSIISSIDTLNDSWKSLIESLKEVDATVEQLNSAEKSRDGVLGANLTGLTAASISQQLVSGGRISDLVSQRSLAIAAENISRKIYEDYISEINNRAGVVFRESGNDFKAVQDFLKTIDFSVFEDGLKSNIELLKKEQEILEGVLEKARKNYINALEREIEAQEAIRDEAEALSKTFINFTDILKQTRIDLLVPRVIPSRDLSYLQSSFDKTLQGVFSGDTESFEELPNLAREVIKSAEKSIADPEQFTRLTIDIAQKLATAESIASQQVNKQNSIIDEAQKQINILTDERDLVAGIADTLLSMKEAADAYYAASTKVQTQKDIISSINPSGDVTASFDTNTYLQNKTAQFNKQLAEGNVDALVAAQKYGLSTTSVSIADIQSAFTQSGLTPEQHFLTYGIGEGLSPSNIQSFGGGGISVGSSNGYLIESHGVEAHIPMDNGDIPVIVKNSSDMSYNEMLKLLTVMINTLGISNRTQIDVRDILERITQGNTYISTKEVA